jgi:xanthine/uracil/vitamin C permease (AzgA family)
MRDVIPHLNYIHVLVVAVAGFLLGWLWYGVLFGRMWMVEMKITPEMAAEEKAKGGMAAYFIKGFLFTLLSTFGLAALIAAHGSPNWKHGAAYGLFVGLFVAAMRKLNDAVWEKKSFRLQAINVGHELVVYAIQGAIFGAWH